MKTTKTTNRILLIDDDPVTNLINTKFINMMFTFRVESYTNAQEALEKCRHWSATDLTQFPMAIFLDINMPIMDGWEFLEEFEKFTPVIYSRCPVYMLTSSIDQEDIDKSRTFNSVADFISKPLSLMKLKMFNKSIT